MWICSRLLSFVIPHADRHAGDISFAVCIICKYWWPEWAVSQMHWTVADRCDNWPDGRDSWGTCDKWAGDGNQYVKISARLGYWQTCFMFCLNSWFSLWCHVVIKVCASVLLFAFDMEICNNVNMTIKLHVVCEATFLLKLFYDTIDVRKCIRYQGMYNCACAKEYSRIPVYNICVNFNLPFGTMPCYRNNIIVWLFCSLQ